VAGSSRPQGEGRAATAPWCTNGGDDLNTVLDRVEPAGGKVTTPKSGNDQSGYVAFFLDTEGNLVGLQSMR
jgi:uncharacterized protein